MMISGKKRKNRNYCFDIFIIKFKSKKRKATDMTLKSFFYLSLNSIKDELESELLNTLDVYIKLHKDIDYYYMCLSDV